MPYQECIATFSPIFFTQILRYQTVFKISDGELESRQNIISESVTVSANTIYWNLFFIISRHLTDQSLFVFVRIENKLKQRNRLYK